MLSASSWGCRLVGGMQIIQHGFSTDVLSCVNAHATLTSPSNLCTEKGVCYWVGHRLLLRRQADSCHLAFTEPSAGNAAGGPVWQQAAQALGPQ